MIYLLLLILIGVCFLCIMSARASCGTEAIKEKSTSIIIYAPTQDAAQVGSIGAQEVTEIGRAKVDFFHPSRRKKTKKSPRYSSEFLDEIQFSYPNKDSITYAIRKISVRAVNAEYLEGHCHTSNATRTFVLQRIRGKVTSLITGEVQRVAAWADCMRRLPNNRGILFIESLTSNGERKKTTPKERNREWQTAACFVGFRDAKRAELESMAEAASWQIRSGFSSTLDILVAGTLAGSKQLKEAESLQIDIISEADFRQRMAELGACP